LTAGWQTQISADYDTYCNIAVGLTSMTWW